MYINVDIANFRTTPGTDSGSTIIKQLHYRARVKELSKNDKWSHIVTDTDETGYVFSEYLTDTMPAVTPTEPAGRTLTKWAAESSLTKSYYSANLADFIGRSIDYLPLQGITVIIDPGHGGADPGAMYNTVMEKTINLSVSLEVGKKLVEMGAEVVYTRSDDRFLSLYYRNALINKYILEKHKLALAAAGEDAADTDRIIGLLDQVMSKNSDVISSGGRGVFLGLGVNADIRNVLDISSEYDNVILLSIHCNSILNADYAHGVEIYFGTNSAIYQDEKKLLVDESPSNPVNPEYQYYDDNARRKFATALRDGVMSETSPNMEMRTLNGGLYAWNFCMLRENNLTGALIELGFLSNKGDREYLLDPVNQKIMALGIAKSIYNYFCAS
jgi:N-acetylmuramoyl-L-alanine amidase